MQNRPQIVQSEEDTGASSYNPAPTQEPMTADSFFSEIGDMFSGASNEVMSSLKGYTQEVFEPKPDLVNNVSAYIGDITNEEQEILDAAQGKNPTSFADEAKNTTMRNFLGIGTEPSSSDTYAGVLGTLEGVKNHVDTQGIGTNAYGVVNDPVNHPEATKANRKAAKLLGIDLNKATPKQSKQVATQLVKEAENTLAGKVTNWSKLNNTSKSFMLDFYYNGGVIAKKLPKALEKYQKDPSEKNLKDIGKEARRSQKVLDEKGKPIKLSNGEYKKEYIKGLDNRVARIMRHFKLIKTLDEAKKYGLPLASDK